MTTYGLSVDSVWRRGAGDLLRAAAILAGKVESAAIATCREQGKTVAEAAGEFARAIETFVWNGEQAATLCSPRRLAADRILLSEPSGTVAAVTPWNYPAILSVRKLVPPLAAGCPMILKAAEESPAAAVALVEVLAEAGLPNGVVSFLFRDQSRLLTILAAGRSWRS